METLLILQATRSLIDAAVIMEEISSPKRELDLQHQEKAASRLAELVSTPHNNVQGDYVYESCRLAAEMVLFAIRTNTAFKDMEDYRIDNLKSAISRTDVGGLWGPMSGVLFWITLTACSVATFGRPHHSYLDSINRRLVMELTYKNTVYEVVTTAVLKFFRLQKAIENSGRSTN
jgi:hypothetical protein